MSNGDAEFDQRFRELIRAEFGDVPGSRGPGEDAAPPTVVRPPQPGRFGVRKTKDPIEYFNLSRAIEEVTTPDDDHDRWDPPVDASLGHPRARVVIGVALLAATLLMGVAVLAGLRPAWWVGVITLLGFGLGLGLLFSALPRHRKDGDGDGARL